MDAPGLLLSTGDAAHALRISVEHVHRLVHLGRLCPAARTARGMLLFDPAEVERLRAARAERRRAKELAALSG